MYLRDFIELKINKTDKTTVKNEMSNLVVLMGDFNVDGKGPDIHTEILFPYFEGNSLIKSFVGKKKVFKEYDLLVHILNVNAKNELTNLALNHLGYQPVTKTTIGGYNDGKPYLMDNYYCNPNKDKLEAKTLDYIFVIKGKDGKSADLKEFKCGINKFTAANGKDYNQLSDHWGLEAVLDVKLR